MMLSDIEIAQKAELKPITEIGASIGIPAEDLENYAHRHLSILLSFLLHKSSNLRKYFSHFHSSLLRGERGLKLTPL